MTSRERLLRVLAGERPDCVPACPDLSVMVPIRLTGKPFWEIQLYNNPPLWEASIECAKYFDIDKLMDYGFPLTFPGEVAADPEWESPLSHPTGSRSPIPPAR